MKLGTTDISAIKLGSTDISKTYLGSSVVYESEETQFYVKNTSSSPITFGIYPHSGTYGRYDHSGITFTMDYSTDKVHWTTLSQTGKVLSITVNVSIPANSTMYFRNANLDGYTVSSTWEAPEVKLITSDTTTIFEVGGLLSTFVNKTNYTCVKFRFGNVKYDASKLSLDIDPTEYVSGSLKYRTYVNSMSVGAFSSNTGLLYAPKMPSTNLISSSYIRMFSGCSALQIGPELPATELKSQCYLYMFLGCESLKYIKVHFTSWGDWSSSSATDYKPTDTWTMLYGNTTGTFVCPSSLTQYFNASGNKTSGSGLSGSCNAIPYGWTVQTY